MPRRCDEGDRFVSARSSRRLERKLTSWRLLLIAGATIAVAYVVWHYLSAEPKRALQAEQSAGPVRTSIVERRDFPVYLSGLGTVQPTYNVTVRSRVDGQIEKVAFTEGQIVREGDLLIQIDAAPFQAALNQTVAKLAQDQASL